MNTFCTIITADYYPKAFALYKSLVQFDTSVQMQVLIADNKTVTVLTVAPGIKLITANELSGYSLVNDLYKKYGHSDMDAFRWSLKPVFISYLLENGFEKVLYSDCDMFF